MVVGDHRIGGAVIVPSLEGSLKGKFKMGFQKLSSGMKDGKKIFGATCYSIAFISAFLET